MTTRRSFLRGAAAGALAAAAAPVLAACADQAPSTPTATGTPAPHPALDADRLTTVLTRIGEGLTAADQARDGEALAGVLSGPALRVRREEYAVAQAAQDPSLVHTFSTGSQAGAVGLTLSFPRDALVVTEPTAQDEPPYLLALRQPSAREAFTLWGWVRLFAGAEVPATSTASVGSEQVGADATGLVSTPAQVLDAYVEALNDPDGQAASQFADDSLRQRVASERAVDLSGAGSVTVSAQAGTDGFVGLRTVDGGALVMTSLTFQTVYTRTKADATVKVGGTVGSLLGDPEVRGTVTATYDAMVAFSVPAEGSPSSPTVLGADLVLASAVRDDAAAPAA